MSLEYKNGVLFQDGVRATPAQVQAVDASNPYVSQNWLATAADRGGRTPGAGPELPTTKPLTSTGPQAIDPRVVQHWLAIAQQRGIPLNQLLEEMNGPLPGSQKPDSGPVIRTSPERTTRPMIIMNAAPRSAPPTYYNTTAGAHQMPPPPLKQILPGLAGRYGQAR